jgi:hypothetical protein
MSVPRMMRKFFLAVLGILAAVFLAAAYVLFPPHLSPFLPQLARGLPRDFETGQAEFTRRLRARFPVGSAETDLLRELEAQGFRNHFEDRSRRYTDIEKRGLPCNVLWRVLWRIDDSTA